MPPIVMGSDQRSSVGHSRMILDSQLATSDTVYSSRIPGKGTEVASGTGLESHQEKDSSRTRKATQVVLGKRPNSR